MTIYQVIHKQRWLSQEIRNTYYYETTVGDPSTSEWQDCVDEIRADYVAELAGHMSNDWSFYGIDYREVSTAGLLSFEAIPTGGDYVGIQTIDNLPTQVALLVSVKGATTKPNRARTYFGGMTEADCTDSLWGSLIRAAFEAFIAQQSVLNAGGTNPLSRVAAQWNSSHTQVIVDNTIAAAAGVASLVPAT